MTRPQPKPHLVAFNLPEVRTLADMSPAERVAIAKSMRMPLSGYDAEGQPIDRTPSASFDTSDS